jgi:hypothetical protein
MRDNLIISPKMLRPADKKATLRFSGTRDGFAHSGRASTCYDNGLRRFLEFSDADRDEIMGELDDGLLLAFVEKRGKQMLEADIGKALRKTELLRRRDEAKARAAHSTALARHQAFLAHLEAVGVAYSDDELEATWKRASATVRRRKTK